MRTIQELLGLLNSGANSLRKARIEQKADLSVEIRMNFIRIKQFIEIMRQDTTTVSSNGQGAEKFQFIIDNVQRNLKFLPREYKAKVQDLNVCSVFYDINNLYEFSKDHCFPAELDAALSMELILLLDKIIDHFTITTPRNALELKSLNQVAKKVIMFDRETKHFHYFSYYNDLKHLSKAIEMIDFLKNIDISQVSGKFQFLSGLGQAFEHLSVRMLSQRMINYISSDISKELPMRIRNFIVHREKDLEDRLNNVLGENGYNFESMRNELIRIGASLTDALAHLHLAVKPRIILGDVIQDLNQFNTNTQAETVGSIHNFYQKIVTNAGAKYKYMKIPLYLTERTKTVENFDAAFQSLANLNSAIKEEIVAIIALGDKEAFNAKIDEFLKIDEYKAFRRDIASLKSERTIQMEELQKLIPPANSLQMDARQKTIFITKKVQFYRNKMLEVINKLNSATDHINGRDLYKLNIDFDLYRVTTIPAYCITNAAPEYVAKSLLAKSAAPQRYTSDFDYYKIKFLYRQGDEKNIKANEIGIGYTFNNKIFFYTWSGSDYLPVDFPNFKILFNKIKSICNALAKNEQNINQDIFTEEEVRILKNHVINTHKLQMILIPLTDQEHSLVYQENKHAHEVSFSRTRVLDEIQIKKINQIFNQEDMTTRINNYLAFLEISKNILEQKELLLEAEFYLSCIEGFNSLIEESTLNQREKGLLRDFRNYLVHDRELGDQTISHSHEQITLRYILEFTRLTEQKIIPVLHDMLAQGVLMAGDNNIISLNVQKITYDNPEEIQKIIEAAKHKVQDSQKNKNTLDKAVDNVGDVLGANYLMDNNFYNFVPKFSFKQFYEIKEKIIMIMPNEEVINLLFINQEDTQQPTLLLLEDLNAQNNAPQRSILPTAITGIIALDILESAPTIKYFFNEVLNFNVEVSQLSNTVWTTMHFAISTITSILLETPGYSITDKLMISGIKCINYGARIQLYDSLDKIGLLPTITIQSLLIIANTPLYGSDKMHMLYNMAISASISGIQCYKNHYGNHTQEKTMTEIIIPKTLDIATAIFASKGISLPDNNYIVSYLFFTKQVLTAVSSVVAVDYTSKMLLSFLSDQIKVVDDYFSSYFNVGSNSIGEEVYNSNIMGEASNVIES